MGKIISTLVVYAGTNRVMRTINSLRKNVQVSVLKQEHLNIIFVHVCSLRVILNEEQHAINDANVPDDLAII